MRIWIGTMALGTTDDEIKAFVKKYSPELECTEIQRVDDSGTRPGAILQFAGTTVQLGNLAVRLHGMYWKGHSLSCHTLLGVPWAAKRDSRRLLIAEHSHPLLRRRFGYVQSRPCG